MQDSLYVLLLEVVLPVERLVAFHAAEGLLSSVQELVPGHVLRASELLSADVAGELVMVFRGAENTISGQIQRHP